MPISKSVQLAISSVHNGFELWALDFLQFQVSSLCIEQVLPALFSSCRNDLANVKKMISYIMEKILKNNPKKYIFPLTNNKKCAKLHE